MANGFFNVPTPINEPVKGYAPNSPERVELLKTLKEFKQQERDIPMHIGGQEVRTGKTKNITPPHDHKFVLGQFHEGDKTHVSQAIDAALAARPLWAEMPWEHRAAIFLKAADLLAGPYRARINAATMLAQSKNCFQAEIDAACELIDFFRFNVHFMQQIYQQQPESLPGMWNRMEHRPLEGFVFALTPFNFTSIAANLPASVAMMGNVVVWKPANTQIYSAQVLMELFKEAGVPDGVINLVYVDGPTAGDVIFKHRDFAGIHFTGSTGVFQNIWKTIGQNIASYKSYPRIVGETGGKDFILAHPSAHAKAVAVGMSRGAFEYQGQKCSAASRVYLPSNLADEILGYVKEDLASFKMGDVEDFSNFINAVISEASFDKLAKYIDGAKADPNAEIVAGGGYDKSKGYFIEPTVIVTKDPKYVTMCEELFGPVLTVHIYDADKFEETLELVDSTSPYALTGAIFAQDRYAIDLASKKLIHAAGNFYINDKPTGAVVGQQPFGGARASGTNDKAGSMLNLLRWVSPRAIKETFVPVTDYRYPFLGAAPAEDLNRDKGL
ncbi:L-glutamate gamma-semialdehyde dehydrogenase [Hymenobacter algoricola]|uniref:L-glutamate gamma-semialdehyde dehydrogenase n=1 Tax=Hymenobacter algoricola TaxID=486267 RepID=A0ABP7NQW1_9BACT